MGCEEETEETERERTMSNYTPGPWRFDPDNLNVFSNGQLAAVYGHTHNGEREANARLIAASPDLLFAAQMLGDVSNHKIDALTHPQLINLILDLRDSARAAITKATGGDERRLDAAVRAVVNG